MRERRVEEPWLDVRREYTQRRGSSYEPNEFVYGDELRKEIGVRSPFMWLVLSKR